MVPYWHVTGSGRNKVADAIKSFEKNTRMIESICRILELVEKLEYARLSTSEELKPIKYFEKAKAINLHEVVIKEDRLQFRILGSVDGQNVTYLETLYKNRDGSGYKNAVENAYSRYQNITQGYDAKERKSIKEFDFYVV